MLPHQVTILLPCHTAALLLLKAFMKMQMDFNQLVSGFLLPQQDHKVYDCLFSFFYQRGSPLILHMKIGLLMGNTTQPVKAGVLHRSGFVTSDKIR